MRIGIDCRSILSPRLDQRAWVGHYFERLLRALLEHDRENEYVLFFDSRTRRDAAQVFEQPNAMVRFLPLSRYSKFLPLAYAHLLTAAAFARRRLDVLHCMVNQVPIGFRWPYVTTVIGLGQYSHPELFPGRKPPPRVLMGEALRRAQRVIAVTAVVRDELREIFGVPEKKIALIPKAATTTLLDLHDRHDDVRRVYQLPSRFVLCVGTIERSKNLPTLFEAWSRLRERRRDMQDVSLVLVGGKGERANEILAGLKNPKLGGKVKYLGYVPHNHKILLMRQALGFVLPTLYEGFPLGVLEAMQVGLPVVSTTTPSVVEVAGDAALLCAPDDAGRMSELIERVLRDERLRGELSEKGQQKARRYTWETTARMTLNVYRQAARH